MIAGSLVGKNVKNDVKIRKQVFVLDDMLIITIFNSVLADAVAKRYRPWPPGLRLTACRGSIPPGPECESTAVYRYSSMRRPGDPLQKALVTKNIIFSSSFIFSFSSSSSSFSSSSSSSPSSSSASSSSFFKHFPQTVYCWGSKCFKGMAAFQLVL